MTPSWLSRAASVPRLGLLLLLAALPPRGAEAAWLRTVDGRVLPGTLRLEADNHVTVTPSNGPPERVPLERLAQADFRAASNAPTANPPSPRLVAQALDEHRGALPEGWRGLDIGDLEKPGSAIQSRGTFTLESWRSAERDREDGFHFVGQTFRGDGEIVARVASLVPRDDKDKQARAGVVLRASLEPEARTVLMSLTGGGGLFFRRWENRRNFGADESRRPDLKPPYWVKLARESNTVTAAHSTDGRRWVVFQNVQEKLPDRVWLGLGVMSRRKDTAATASFDHVQVRALMPRGPYLPRLVLRDGTVLTDPLPVLGDTLVQFSSRTAPRVLTMHVSRLLLQPLDDPTLLPGDRTGVLLTTGDFVDCDITGVNKDRVNVTSILFGQRTYDLRRKVAALAFRPVHEQPAAFLVHTLEGAVLRARALRFQENEVVFDTAHAGTWHLPAAELEQIRRLP